ncbi:hypothetical protein EDB81DRAFT_789701 [Dactylonectria macrodidyma]|uniref:Uncharacterized protein n=1 Tax=Dactylonectria macrodidyma TaxID=307937 RepID=A0A9P9F4G9_9HYPO|nr:hypothetical protein EDB81DRAFT_789701 [Dactylonectria macrodidyma]
MKLAMTYPTGMTMVFMLGLSAVCAASLTLLQVVWGMWDPLGRGLNTYGWTLAIAKEIDEMLDDFKDGITRVHSYVL